MVKCAPLLLLLVVMVGGASTVAQTQNPTVADCGLPAAGTITGTVTYTLTSDCAQTGEIKLNPGASVTINGEGYTIRGSFARYFQTVTNNTTLILNELTIDNGDNSVSHILNIASNTAFTMTDVTIRNSNDGLVANFIGNSNTTLTNVLFENNSTRGWGPGTPSVLLITGNATVTMNGAVFRNNQLGAAAIAINNSGSLTATGCLSFSGNIPGDVAGTWTDNSTGACTGTIGNGDSAAIAAPAVQTCGLPAPGALDKSATYALRSDCNLGKEGSHVHWRIPKGVTIRIEGNGRRLLGGSGDNRLFIWQGGSLTINNLVLDHVTFVPFGALTFTNSKFQNNPSVGIFLVGTANIRNSIFENFTRAGNFANVLGTWSAYGAGHATITDSIFRKNVSKGAGPVMETQGDGTITLNGCITFEDNAPANYPSSANLTDNSTGPCGPGVVIGPSAPPAPKPAEAKREPAAAPGSRPATSFQQLGEIGAIFRRDEPNVTLEIWSVDDDSVGKFVISLRPADVAAIHEGGLFESSPDGRVAFRLIGSRCVVRNSHGDDPRVSSSDCIASELTSSGSELGNFRHLAISMGPNREGKVYTVVIDNNGWGHVIGMVDTRTGLPGRPHETADTSAVATTAPEQKHYAPSVQPQPASASGSIIHVVQPGDTVWQIGIAYNVDPFKIIARNQLDRLRHRGANIFPGQKLIVVDA
jgi:hypothetical protein